MDIAVAHPRFRRQRLSVQTAGFFRGSRVLLNGVRVKRAKKRYVVRNDSGENVSVELKHSFLDPIPRVRIGEETIELARPLVWYEYLWMGVPILLVFAGGGLGVLVGILAIYASARVFRGARGMAAKYIFTALISIGAFLVFALLAVIAESVIGALRQ